MSTIRIVTEAGRQRTLPARLDRERVAGLDPDGRIVVDDFDARNAEPMTIGGYVSNPFMFGLTLCCDASDKGMEDGVGCRGCYSLEEAGSYLYRAPDGTFPDLDPIRVVIVLPAEVWMSDAARASEIDAAAAVSA